VRVVGNHSATPAEIRQVQDILSQRGGGIDYTKDLAQQYIDKALPFLDEVPESDYRTLLNAWAQYMIHRKY
jgi:geranylgeranyl pyrophosphate synthase